jgi:hypothetical protein
MLTLKLSTSWLFLRRSRFDEHANLRKPSVRYAGRTLLRRSRFDEHANYKSLARAGHPLYNRIAFNGAPSDDKLAISSCYFVRLATASYSSHLLTTMEHVLPEALLVSL